MEITARITRLLRSEARHLTYSTIPHSQAGLPKDDYQISAGNAYFQIWLNEMFLQYSRELWKAQYPVVQAFVKFIHNNRIQEFHHIASPGHLMLTSATKLEQIVNINHKLFGPIPYSGGNVELTLGLFAARSADYALPFINLLTSVSSIVVTTQLSVGMVLAEPLKKSLDELFNSGNLTLKLGMHTIYESPSVQGSQHPLTGGYYVILAAPPNKVPSGRLWVKNGRLHEGDSVDQCVPLTGYDYLLFRIERLTQRDDWTTLEFVSYFYEDLKFMLRIKDKERLLRTFEAFKHAVLTSPDLIWADRVRLVKAMNKRIDELVTLLGIDGEQPFKIRSSRQREQAIPPFDAEISQVLRPAISVKQAQNITLEELLSIKPQIFTKKKGLSD